MTTESKCPFSSGAGSHTSAKGSSPTNADWWPEQLNLKMLHQRSNLSNPLGSDFDYAQAFAKLVAEQFAR